MKPLVRDALGLTLLAISLTALGLLFVGHLPRGGGPVAFSTYCLAMYCSHRVLHLPGR